MAAADCVLRRMLLAIPATDPDAAALHAFADLLKPLNDEEVPPAFKAAGGLPLFQRRDLYWQPFSVRVGPPKTAWLPRRPPQPPPPSTFRPQSIRDLLTPPWFEALSDWYERMGSWLLDLSEAVQKGDNAPIQRVISARPEVLVVPASGFVPAAQGIVWDLRQAPPAPADFTQPIDTHLNLDLIRQWMLEFPDYPDREIFSHLLEGVRFKTDTATQIVLQPHLTSLADGFVSVHKELVRLMDKNFFESYTHPPYAPWVTMPMGVAFRKLEPDRPRRTTDGGAPRKGRGASPFLVDQDGVRVLPVNLLARHPADDIARGTSHVFAQAWAARLANDGHNPPLEHTACGKRPLPPARLSPLGTPKVLLLFSGDVSSQTSLARCLVDLGLEVRAVDTCVGGADDDMRVDHVVRRHVSDIERGAYSFVFAATPCKSYSIAPDGSRPQLRTRAHPRGAPGCPAAWQAYVDRHNTLADATIACLLSADRSSTPWAVENPAARWDSSTQAHWPAFADWGTLWDLFAALGVAPARTLPAGTQPRISGILDATFAACAFGAPYQKFTTVWASKDASALIARLRGRRCSHMPSYKHEEILQGRLPDGTNNTSAAAAYHPALARALAEGIEEVLYAVSVATSLTPSVRAPSSLRPSVNPRPAAPALRDSSLVDVNITRHGGTPLMANPFKLGPTGKDERLRQLAFVTYHDWIELRTVASADMRSALPVAASMSRVTGDDVLADVRRLVARYGRTNAFNLVCGRRCHGKLCHGAVLAALFEQVIESSEDLPFPKELKPAVPEIMGDLAILMHLSSLTDIPVYQIVSPAR